ncbi:NAD-specific glutamate dehydrogenase [Vibrio ponticus]|nr:NAD-specific glutamate dehydrogenase [Vibrio ponticus]
MGCNFVTRLQEETGASVVDIANAYVASREIFGLGKVLEQIRALDNTATTTVQYDMMFAVRRTLRRVSRWILRNRKGRQSVTALIDLYRADVDKVKQDLDTLLVPLEVEDHNQEAQAWVEQGMTADLANYVARLSSLYSVLDVSTVSTEKGIAVDKVAQLYFNLGDRLSIHWFLNQINNQAVDNHWQALARAAFREDLDWQQRLLTAQVLSCGCQSADLDVIQSLDDWIANNQLSLNRWESILNEFKVGSVHEFAKFSVALRELMLLNLNCSANE